MKVLIVGFHNLWDLMSHGEQVLKALEQHVAVFYTHRQGNLAVRDREASPSEGSSSTHLPPSDVAGTRGDRSVR